MSIRHNIFDARSTSVHQRKPSVDFAIIEEEPSKVILQVASLNRTQSQSRSIIVSTADDFIFAGR